jgi:hypothetical protein
MRWRAETHVLSISAEAAEALKRPEAHLVPPLRSVNPSPSHLPLSCLLAYRHCQYLPQPRLLIPRFSAALYSHAERPVSGYSTLSPAKNSFHFFPRISNFLSFSSHHLLDSLSSRHLPFPCGFKDRWMIDNTEGRARAYKTFVTVLDIPLSGPCFSFKPYMSGAKSWVASTAC